MTVLQAKDISKSYGTLHVLKSVSLQINEREIVSIVGASGAGKSTLLQIIGTLDKPDRGSILIEDIDINKLKEKELAKFRNEKMGFVFQFHYLLPEFTAIENVIIPAMIANSNTTQATNRAKELLAYFGLQHRLQHKPAELSGGEQQRVAVARALMNNPRIVFADEPSGNLDSNNAKELHELFFKLRDDFNQTFVIVTHNENLANMSDRKIVMKDGNIIE